MKRWKIVVTDRLAPPADIEEAVFGGKARVVILGAGREADILKEIKDADGLLVWHEVDITKRSLSLMKKCRVIVRVGVGFDNVDLRCAAKRKMYVCNVPDYGVNDVADHTWALILAFYRDIEEFVQRSRDGGGRWTWEGAGARRLTGETLAVIGLGRIGTAVALRAKAFGVKVVFYDPYIPRGIEKSLSLERADDLRESLAGADIVSFHVPLTDETRGMADEAFFKAAKKGALIINTARGGVIDMDALYDAMKGGKVWAAGLDVLSKEPPDNDTKLIRAWRRDEPWLRHRLLITPHCAFYSQKAFDEMRRKAAQEVKRVLEGKKPLNCVNYINYVNYKTR